jgi:type IV secretory pathway VirB2 component (pilin)
MWILSQRGMAAAQKSRRSKRSAWLSFGFLLTLTVILIVGGAPPLHAQSPWENAVTVLRDAFTTTIARGLSLVAIVVGGITMSFDEGGGSKRMLAGILFGVGMAIGAVNFMSWLFP